MLCNDPVDDLLGIDIYGKRFHSDILRVLAFHLVRAAVHSVDLAQGKMFSGSPWISEEARPILWFSERPRAAAALEISSPGKYKGPRLPSVETEVSSGVLGRGSYGPLRHASSADWFMA
jgi:hypothetical protein